MQTRKLYYEDCLLDTFCATVTGCQPEKNGWLVTLDATAFYPEGGGQPCDLGTLDGIPVLDVKEREETVIHLCAQPLAVGQQVTGQIDWARRLDLMQQHSGEHIVSGIIHRMFGYHNVGFHIGADVMTIDFDGPITMQELTQIERQANEAVWQNLPVRCGYPTQEELPTVAYRSKKALPWPVRIVEIPGADTCACCGVHVAYTGQIGVIKLLSCVKFHQGVRIEMVCGGRALQLLNAVFEQNRQVSQTFSAKILETADAARRVNEQLAAEKFRSSSLQQQVFRHVAASYENAGNVLHFADSLTPGAVRELADTIARVCGGTAAVLSGSDADGYSFCLIGPDANTFGAGLVQNLRARGGGKPGSFQGNLQATRKQIEAFF